MAKNNGPGCLAWIIIGVLVVAVLSRCGKDDAVPSPNGLFDLPSQPAPESLRYVRPTSLNCRAEPSSRSPSLRVLARGDYVGVVESRGDWSLLTGGVRCWAKASYLSADKPDSEPDSTPARQDTVKSAASRLSSSAIKRQLIAASIDGYPGNCACPYNVTRNGSRCGGRSAYSRGGGYAPLCYPGDISSAEVKAWREREP